MGNDHIAPCLERETDFSSEICVEKKVKLFGFELNPSNAAEGDESVNSSTTVSCNNKAKFECQYCFKEFTNSQALGGHQNAHKKERMKKKKMQIQARKVSLSYYLQPFRDGNGNFFCDFGSPPWIYSEGSSPEIRFERNDAELIRFEGCEERQGFSLTEMDKRKKKGVILQSSSSSSDPKHSSSSCKSLDLRLGLNL